MGEVNEGRGGVVRELLAGAAAEFEAERQRQEGAQLPLLPVPTRFHGSKGEAIAAQVERRSGPGRPGGAQNLTTKAFREWLLARGVSPLVSLMRYAILPPDLLALELGCTRLEAFREWRILQSELAPFMHAKLAFVDDQGNAVPFLQMVVGGQAVTIHNGETPWQARERLAREIAETQQNQGVGATVPAVSHTPLSHDPAK